ncbi:carbohydrate sulfotransferase 15-like isoform X2 [Amphiura filiformis]
MEVSLLTEKPMYAADSQIWIRMQQYFPEVIGRLKRDFLPEYKNPCFLEGNRTRCLPYFYLGGAPKCGTTDLWFNLLRHPRVFKNIVKEPHFLKNIPKTYSGTEKYLNHFDTFAKWVSGDPYGAAKSVVGDGSASTLWANYDIVKKAGIQTEGEIPFVFADVIHAIHPKAKVIFILRDPTNRTISDYFLFSRDKSPTHFHAKVVQKIEWFEQCLRSRSLKSCANVLGSRDIPRLGISVYIAHIREWLRVFPKDQVLILRTEDWHYHEDTNLLQDVFKFLDIEALPESNLQPIKKKETLNEIKSKQITQRQSNKHGDILPKTRKLLDEFYAPYNKQLATFLKDKRFLWNT